MVSNPHFSTILHPKQHLGKTTLLAGFISFIKIRLKFKLLWLLIFSQYLNIALTYAHLNDYI